jgi:hypothetical protein
MPNQPVCTPQKKAETIKIALERSPMIAAKESGIHLNTIKNWLYEARKATEAKTGDPTASLGLRPSAQTSVVQQVVDRVTSNVQDVVFDRSVEKYEKAQDRLLSMIEQTISTIQVILVSHDWSSDVSVDWLDSLTKALGTSIDKYQIMTGGATSRVDTRSLNLHVSKADEYDGIFKRIGAGERPKEIADPLSSGEPVDSVSPHDAPS